MLRQLLWMGAGLGLAAPAAAQAAPSTAPGFVAEAMLQFEASMRKFVALAEAMPAETYGWSPGPGVMTVARVYAHVTRYNYLYPSENLGVPAPDGRAEAAAEDLADKAVLVARLRESRDFVRQAVRGLTDPSGATELYGRTVPQWSVLLQLVAHMNEHLGQAIGYARMNGVVPPWSR